METSFGMVMIRLVKIINFQILLEIKEKRKKDEEKEEEDNDEDEYDKMEKPKPRPTRQKVQPKNKANKPVYNPMNVIL